MNKYSKKLYQNIPSEWELKQINHIAKKRIEKNGIDSDIYVGIENLVTGAGRISGYEDQSSFNTKQIFTKNDLLYARIRPYLNKIWLSNVEGYCSTDIIVIKTSGVNPKLLKELMLTPEFVNFAVRHSAGTKMPRVNWGDIKKLHIPVSPLVEQHGIIEVLGTVDECIRLTDAVIERAEELKRGLMQQLLTRGIGHTEYKETPLGEIPKTWENTIIYKYCYVTKLAGFEYTKYIKYKEKGEIIALRGINLSDDGLNLSKIRYIDKETSNFLKRSKLYKNDIVMTFIGVNIGDVVIIPVSDKYHCAPNIAKITVKNEEILNPQFLLWYLKSHNAQKHIKSLTKSTAKQSINMSEIRTVKLLLPTKNEQDIIVDRLNKIQQNISIETQKILLLNNLKVGLAQLLLSGKIRVELKGDGLHRIGDSREANN